MDGTTPPDEDRADGIDRRRFLRDVAVATAAVYAAPTVTRVALPHAAAAPSPMPPEPPPTDDGGEPGDDGGEEPPVDDGGEPGDDGGEQEPPTDDGGEPGDDGGEEEPPRVEPSAEEPPVGGAAPTRDVQALPTAQQRELARTGSDTRDLLKWGTAAVAAGGAAIAATRSFPGADDEADEPTDA